MDGCVYVCMYVCMYTVYTVYIFGKKTRFWQAIGAGFRVALFWRLPHHPVNAFVVEAIFWTSNILTFCPLFLSFDLWYSRILFPDVLSTRYSARTWSMPRTWQRLCIWFIFLFFIFCLFCKDLVHATNMATSLLLGNQRSGCQSIIIYLTDGLDFTPGVRCKVQSCSSYCCGNQDCSCCSTCCACSEPQGYQVCLYGLLCARLARAYLCVQYTFIDK